MSIFEGVSFGLAKVKKKAFAAEGDWGIPFSKEREFQYIGFKKGSEMKFGIPVSTALALPLIAALGIAAWVLT